MTPVQGVVNARPGIQNPGDPTDVYVISILALHKTVNKKNTNNGHKLLSECSYPLGMVV